MGTVSVKKQENIEKSIDYFIEKPYYIVIGVYHSMLKGCIKN